MEQALRESNETLEARVEQRTREAEAANLSKTRFLAAISHDVLQPINAARLFTSALRDTDEGVELHRLAERVDASLRDAEELLDGLLDVSRLDAGSLKPELTVFRLDDLLMLHHTLVIDGHELRHQLEPIAFRQEQQELPHG